MGRGCQLDVDHTSFEANAANYAAHLLTIGLRSVKISYTKFAPFKAGSATSVQIAGALGGCEQNPCPRGERCSYTNYSLSCTPCDPGTVGLDGQQCTLCLPGYEPAKCQWGIMCTVCSACSSGKYSAFGANCANCTGVTQPRAPRTQCQTCPVGQEVNPTSTACQCKEFTYNTSALTVLCVAGRYAGFKNADVVNKSGCHVCPSCLNCSGAGMEWN